MYSMFDLFFDTPAYRPIYVISDSEMKELQRTQNQDELEEIRHQKKRLEESYKAQVKHLDEREKELKTELKSIEPAKKKFRFWFFYREEGLSLFFYDSKNYLPPHTEI